MRRRRPHPALRRKKRARRIEPAPHRLRSRAASQYSGLVPSAARALRASFGRGLKYDLIQQTAYFTLVFRVVEGLAAWLLFNVVFLPVAPDAWPIHLVVIGYLVGNLLLGLRYRSGEVTPQLVLGDLLLNVGTMTLLAGFTGGVLSPVVMLILFKIAGYAFVFGPHTGLIAIVTTLTSFVGLAGGEQLGWWSLASIDILPLAMERQIDFVFRVFVLGSIFIGATWLFNQLADKERLVGTEAQRAKVALDREHAAAIVTGALLAVSEAVSRLTSLDDILNKVVDVAPRILAVDYCGIFLWNEESGTYRGAAVSGVDPALAREVTSIRLSPEEVPDLEWARRLGHCAVMAPRGIARLGAPEAPHLLTAPLLSGGRFYGALLLGRRDGKPAFNQRELTIADGVAGQTAVALERARLADQSRRLVRAVESTDEAVLITDREGRVAFANPALLEMFGYTADELRGRDARQLSRGLSDEWIREVQRAIVEKNWRGEVTVYRKDGTAVPVTLNTSLIRGNDNRVEGAVVIMEDVSARKALQERLHRADRLAAAGELAAGVAHEVNNALSGILGQAEYAREASDIESLRAALARVETQGRRIADIVQELLGFARPQPPQRGPVDLPNLVRDTLGLMAHDLGRGRIRSETHFAPDLPPVLADAKQIQQVLVNLLTNAMQAMDPAIGGALVVTIQRAPGVVALEVHDQGVGIAAEDLPRVFDPFFSTKEKGTGLGLSVSYTIVRAHGGDLTVRSAPGAGTTFTLTLPAVAAAAGTIPRTVLLVDDDEAVAETLSAMLTREGLTVQRAASGRAALAQLAEHTFDAIFLDVRLPDISGQEVYAQLAAERPELARRVVFVTGGLWRIESRGLREKLPPQPTLGKPCTAAQIREVLRLIRDTRAAA